MGENQHLENLQEIRSIMEKSTKFLSLSGLSGVMAGVSALVGAAIAYSRILSELLEVAVEPNWFALQRDLLIIAACILCSALGFAFFFTARKAKREEIKMWNKTSKNILLNLSIPLLTGGFVALVLMKHGYFIWIAPFTLIFYGLACINASHRTVRDIFYLGATCLVLGLMSTLFLGYGLIFWALGFGVAHIVYGTLMYFKYDRKA